MDNFVLEMTAAVLSRANERINCDKKSEMKRFRCLESINDYYINIPTIYKYDGN